MSHPLSCWDMCLEGMHRRMFLAEDLTTMNHIIEQGNWFEPQVSITDTLIWENKVIVITDANLNIVHATANMVHLNGYRLNEVVGKSPSMFQGEKTEMHQRSKIKQAIVANQSFETNITNYRKDGSIYICHIEGYPIFDNKGKLVNFLALENAA